MTDILFVDDRAEELAQLEKSLKKYRQDWLMDFALGGEEALEMIQSRDYDAVVADLEMPRVSGPELLRQVQQQSPETVRVLLSYNGEQTQAIESTSVAHQHLAKPCDVDLLEMVIEDALALRYHLDSKAIRDLVGRIDHLPTLPDTYVRLLAELDSPHSSLARVGEIVSGDVAITAKLLQLVNSSYFGLPVHVTDISHAVALLGIKVVKPLVLSSGLFEQFSPGALGDFSLEHFINHSTEVALGARCIAQLEGASSDDCDNAFLAGMLHDLGQLVLAQKFTARTGDGQRNTVARIGNCRVRSQPCRPGSLPAGIVGAASFDRRIHCVAPFAVPFDPPPLHSPSGSACRGVLGEQHR